MEFGNATNAQQQLYSEQYSRIQNKPCTFFYCQNSENGDFDCTNYAF